jgi:hypothetical protein
MENYFIWFLVELIDRRKNSKTDELAKMTARKIALHLDIFFQIVEDLSIKTIESESRMVHVIQGEDWQVLIIAFLHHHYDPDNKTELLRMWQRARGYNVIDNELYKTSVTRPLLCCLRKAEGKGLLVEIHSGVCGEHIGARALAAKVFKQGFYWLSIIDDGSMIIATCEAYQKFSPNSRALSQPSQRITPS